MGDGRRAGPTRMAEEIIGLDPQMRFVAIIDRSGHIVESIMQEGKTSLKSQREEEHFCRQVAQRRRMRTGFDGTLGRVGYVHVEREKLTQIVVYTNSHTVYFTLEPELPMDEKTAIITRVKNITGSL